MLSKTKAIFLSSLNMVNDMFLMKAGIFNIIIVGSPVNRRSLYEGSPLPSELSHNHLVSKACRYRL